MCVENNSNNGVNDIFENEKESEPSAPRPLTETEQIRDYFDNDVSNPAN